MKPVLTKIHINDIKQMICEAVMLLERYGNPYFAQNQIANDPQLFDKLVKDCYNQVGGKFSARKLADYIVAQIGLGSSPEVRKVITKLYYNDYKDYFIERDNNSQVLEILRDPKKLLTEIEKVKQYAENNFDIFTRQYFTKYLFNGDTQKARRGCTIVNQYIKKYNYGDYFETFDFFNPTYSIYCFQDMEENAVYIGLTRNFEQRKNTHKTGMFRGLPSHSTVYNHFKEKGEEVPDPKILKDGLTAVKAQLEESYWVSYFYDKGFKILNIAETGGLGNFIALGRYQKEYNYAKQQLRPGQVIDKHYLINLFPTQNANGKTEGELLYNYFLKNREKYNLDWEISFGRTSQEKYDKKFEEAKAKAAEVGEPFSPIFLQTYGSIKNNKGSITKAGPYYYLYQAFYKWKANPEGSKYDFSHWERQFDKQRQYFTTQKEYDKKFEEAKARAAEVGKPFTPVFLAKYGPYNSLYEAYLRWKKNPEVSKYDFSHWERQFDNYSEAQNNNQLMNNNGQQYN